MSTLSPGAICMCPRASGAQLWVVVGRADDGRWRLRGKRVDWRGRSDVTCRVAGAGDLVLIRPAPTYSPGTMIEHMRSRRNTHTPTRPTLPGARWSM